MLVVSDSIVKDVIPDKINKGGRNKLICIPGGTLPQIRRAVIDECKQSHVVSLILNVGSNHIPFESPIKISNQLSMFCEEIRVNLPDTRLLFSGILPKMIDTQTPYLILITIYTKPVEKVDLK